MKQFQFEYKNKESFSQRLLEFHSWSMVHSLNNIMFQVYSVTSDLKQIKEVCDCIESQFPDAPYAGCTTSGNVVNCQFYKGITVICTVFEKPTTKVDVQVFDCNRISLEDIADELIKQSVQEDLKAIEIYPTARAGLMTHFCEKMSEVREKVQIYGAIACNEQIQNNETYIFAKDCQPIAKGMLVMQFLGEDLHVEVSSLTGWKELGRKFKVTKAKDEVIYELDGKPAYDIYEKYLHIKNDENFFLNTLEFPLFYEKDGFSILRLPTASNPDGSIRMTTDIKEGARVSLSYGEPTSIIDTIKEHSNALWDFQPDVMRIFTCAARLSYWRPEEPTYEMYPMKEISSSSGFYSGGEFIRTGKELNQHNVTMIISSMREGDKEAYFDFFEKKEGVAEDSHEKVPLVFRMATFISSASKDLEEMNQQLQQKNEELRTIAITDGLTKLFNRKEMQKRIRNGLEHIEEQSFSLIMLDIDNFKRVNDTYGHQEGDNVIIAMAKLIKDQDVIGNYEFSSGRWGGEEFMIMINECDEEQAKVIAERIRCKFADISYPEAPKQTTSIGVTQATVKDPADGLFTRVDAALYESKKTGKNKITIK